MVDGTDTLARDAKLAAVFEVVDRGQGALIFKEKESQLHDNISGEFETFPGVYYAVDGHRRTPVTMGSSDG